MSDEIKAAMQNLAAAIAEEIKANNIVIEERDDIYKAIDRYMLEDNVTDFISDIFGIEE